MTPDELREAQERLEEFLGPLLALVGRAERRRWAQTYVQGLLLEVERKSSRAIARAIADADVQALQQFVNQSPWEWMPVRTELARRIIQAFLPKYAWWVDEIAIPKKGSQSVGVARQGAQGVRGRRNVQVAIALSLINDHWSVPIDVSLYLPEPWVHDPQLKEYAGIPDDIRYGEKWQLALALIDQARQWDMPSGVVAAGSAFGTVDAFRDGLTKRSLLFHVGVEPSIAIRLHTSSGYAGLVGPRPRRRGRPRKIQHAEASMLSAAQLAQETPENRWVPLTWHHPDAQGGSSRFSAHRVCVGPPGSSAALPDAPFWLLIEWPLDAPQPTGYWLSNLPEDTPLSELVYWAKLPACRETAYRRLRQV